MVMNFQDNEKKIFNFGLNMLFERDIDGYKLKSIDIDTDTMIFANGDKKEKISIKEFMKKPEIDAIREIISDTNKNFNEDIDPMKIQKAIKNIKTNPQLSHETSEMNTQIENLNFSDTSDLSEALTKQTGGSKNIFHKSQLTDKSDKYSDSSIIEQIGGKSNEMFNYSKSLQMIGKSDKYSDTSNIGQTEQIGGKTNETDTLMSLSELKHRKNSKQSNLDMGIFKKVQSGGNVDSNIKKKMINMGINSTSSTTSICE